MNTYITTSKLDVKMIKQEVYSGSIELIKQLDNIVKLYPELKEHVQKIYSDSIEKHRIESDNLTEIEFKDGLGYIIYDCHFRYLHYLATNEYTYNYTLEESFKSIYKVYVDKGAKEINNILDQIDKADIRVLEAYKLGKDLSLPLERLQPPSQKDIVVPKYPGLD